MKIIIKAVMVFMASVSFFSGLNLAYAFTLAPLSQSSADCSNENVEVVFKADQGPRGADVTQVSFFNGEDYEFLSKNSTYQKEEGGGCFIDTTFTSKFSGFLDKSVFGKIEILDSYGKDKTRCVGAITLKSMILTITVDGVEHVEQLSCSNGLF